MKKVCSLIISIVICLSVFFNTTTVKAWYLEPKGDKDVIRIGTKVKVQCYAYGGKLIKWWTTNKNLKIVKKNKKYCIVKARKIGKCYVKARVRETGGKIWTLKTKIIIKKKSKVTYSRFLDIEKGMTLNQVKKIIGKPSDHYNISVYNDYVWDDVLDEWVSKRIRTENYAFRNPFNGAEIVVRFENGLVDSCDYYKN